jgi:putative membrane protein
MKIRQGILLLLGLGLLTYLISQTGWQQILDQITKLKWNLVPIVLVYALVYTFDTLGWKFSFRKQDHPVSFFHLFWIRLAGEAVNNTTPTGYVGGEPVKAYMLKSFNVGMPEGFASLVAAKTTLTLSQILFIVFGLAAAFIKLDLSLTFKIVMTFMLVFLTVMVVLFTFFQQKGLFTSIAKMLSRLKIGQNAISKKMEKIKELEAHLADFYKYSKWQFIFSFSFHFLGWLAGVLEIYLIIIFLGLPLNLLDAFMIETLHQLIRGLAFWVPGNIGTQEGGNFFIFTLFGLSGAVGLSVSLIRRIRELIWAVLGWGILIFYKERHEDFDLKVV